MSMAATMGTMLLFIGGASTQRQMERLGRGLVAINQGGGKVCVGWRLLGTDPDDIAFNLYRSTGGGDPIKLNDQPITESTNFVDNGADLSRENSWFVRPLLKGKEQESSAPFTLPENAPAQPYISIPLQTPEGYRPNDASVGDLDGDGEYEVILHQAGRGRDNAHSGTTSEPILEAYKLDGTFLWRINLGRNIREGAHYTQFMVYDLDGDGRAEVACKTADGTIDGKGEVIGDADADYRNSRGYVLEGPEFLTVFDGETGAELVTTDYIPRRGNVRDWGDDYGNRVDRFLACIAYLDGERPSLVMCRGYYTRTVLAAWNWGDGKLTHVWTFDSDDGTPDNRAYRGQGNHNLSVGDVDGDGKDEIVYGACAIDHDGKGLYSTGLGHGDAMHLSDIDPDRPGLEVFSIHERPRHPYGANLRDARTGEVIWGVQSGDAVKGVAMDIDPRHRGYECWATGQSLSGLYNCKGERISDVRPRSCTMGVWWDGDVLREILDGTSIAKWDYANGRAERLLSAYEYDCVRNNGSKSNPCLHADILGDWREEVIWRTRDNRELRIFTTTIPTERRFYTLMHDPMYRLSVAWQNVAYNQPTQTGFYMGEGMAAPPDPKIRTPVRARGDEKRGAVGNSKAPAQPGKVAPKPLYRDPVFDGAADPVLCWNRAEGKWFMFYTNRRATAPNTPGVSWVHGTRIGIAESSDGGATWKYRGTAEIDYGDGDYSYWAPEVIHHDGTYHMFLTFVPGMHTDWSGTRDIIHLTSTDLLKWKCESTLKLASNRVIDACVIQLLDGTWRMWYNNESDRKSIYYADSRDLFTWRERGRAIGDQPGEGPKVFRWKNHYWMVVDVWDGLGVYRSDDCLKWARQVNNLLREPGRSPTDRGRGGHPDVVVSRDRAFMFYFIHQGGRDADPNDPYAQRRSVIQVVELECKDGEIVCDRDKPTHISLQPSEDKR